MAHKIISYELSQNYIPSDVDIEKDLTGADAPTPQPAEPTIGILKKLLDDSLTKKQKCYIILYYRDSLTVSQIAQRFKVNKSTVSRTIMRGRRRLAGEVTRAELKKLINGSATK